MITIPPEKILFTDRKGNTLPLEEVIADGLDGGYEERVPALMELVKTGSPYYRLMACIVLTSWGHRLGFETIIDWASDLTAVPWARESVTVDRIYSADDAFENLADALRTSYWNDTTPDLRKMQRDTARALLRIYPQVFFGRTLALALLRDKIWQSYGQSEIAKTILTSINTAQTGKKLSFDLTFQTASLLLVLARANDELTAKFAESLLSYFPANDRMLREIALALRDGQGPATLRVLDKLQRLGRPNVVVEVKKSLALRQGKADFMT